MARGFRIAVAVGIRQKRGMETKEPSVEEKETRPRWWTIGYRLTNVLVVILLAWSFTGFPDDRVVTVLESSALSESDLIQAGMAIQSELAKDPSSPAAADLFKTEGWRTLERAVDDHREHFHAIEQEQRWWLRLFNWGMVAAFLGLVVFGKLQECEDNRNWDENLPKGRKHLWGKVPR